MVDIYILMENNFDIWARNKWYEHRREVLSWERKVVNYTFEHWLEKNKSFLEKMFKEENKKDR